MYIAEIPNRSSPPAILLREGYREAGKVKNRTLANLSMLPAEAIAALRRVLKGETLVPIDQVFEIVEGGSRHHGHIEAVLVAMRRLGFAPLIASRHSRQRDLVIAMVVARIVESKHSKLATTRWWHQTTLPEILNIEDADEDDLYAAMDWVLERQNRIEKKLAAQHLGNDSLALYDLSSSYFEGVTCPLAALGHNRDGKKGKLQVNYGLLTNRLGIPVAVSVFPGNQGDTKTLLPQIEKIRDDFGIQRFAMVGDRGMITQKQINVLRDLENIDWITALRPEAIRKLLSGGVIQMGLFDERNLFELTHPDFPGERLMACRNSEVARRRANKRKSLLAATAQELEVVRRMVQRGRLHGREAIGKQVRKVVQGYQIGKYFTFEIHDDGFDFTVDQEKIAAQAAAIQSGGAEGARKRRERYLRHVATITEKLAKVRHRIEYGRLQGQDAIGVRVGKVVDKYKVGKHFQLDIEDNRFDFTIDKEKVAAEAALDGIYVVRTSVAQQRLSSDDVVRSYKLLSHVERAFRSFKTIDLKVRPIRHRLENRVRAHIFLCMLAYYVQWHMTEAWRPLLFCDEHKEAHATRDPVAPAQRSAEAMHKVHTKRLDDGTVVHSFPTLLDELKTIVRNTCRRAGAGPDEATFPMDTPPDAKQRRAYDLLREISM
jgi:transposase